MSDEKITHSDYIVIAKVYRFAWKLMYWSWSCLPGLALVFLHFLILVSVLTYAVLLTTTRKTQMECNTVAVVSVIGRPKFNTLKQV